MKKAILALGIIILLTGITLVPVGATSNKTVVKEGTVHGPFIAPSIIGTLCLQEVPEYSSEFHIGELYIYRYLKLTGIACGPGPQDPEEPRDCLYFRQFPFIGGRLFSYQGKATIIIDLYIGCQVTSNMIFMGHQCYGVTFEELQ